jgi:hypothetical protein
MEIAEKDIAAVRLIKANPGMKGRIIMAVNSRSRRLTHVVYVDLATGKAAHSVHNCECQAANAGRKCWHTAAAVAAAQAWGYEFGRRRMRSVFDTPPRRDRVEEI